MPKNKKQTKEELNSIIADRIVSEVLEFHFIDMTPETIYKVAGDIEAILSQEL